jgi:hypothetical protein
MDSQDLGAGINVSLIDRIEVPRQCPRAVRLDAAEVRLHQPVRRRLGVELVHFLVNEQVDRQLPQRCGRHADLLGGVMGIIG